MAGNFNDVKVSIAFVLSEDLPYDRAALAECVRSAIDQTHPSVEVLLIDDRGPAAMLEADLADLSLPGRVRHLPGRYANRAACYNAAVRAATGEFLLIVLNQQAQVVLRRAAVQTMVMAALRCGAAGMVYGDYELIDAQHQRREVHLLDWHAGRLRDTVDFGAAALYPIDLVRDLGGLDERFKVADIYDLRLRVTEKRPAVHIANRYAGSLYTVAAPARKHNVFDYLLADKAGQREMERALTDHLARTGAYLAPSAHVQHVRYGPTELLRFERCLASVVIPVNRRPEFIGRAIESVQGQSIRKVEVIVVVNGGQDDPTCAAVRRYLEGGECYDPAAPRVRLIVVDVNNIGLCQNTGVAAADGKYYVQLDSDDRLKPDAIERLIAVFESDPSIGMVIGSYEVWVLDEQTGRIERDRSIPVVTHDEWTADNGRNNLLRINGAGAPRSAHISVIREVGWFGVNDDPSCRNYGEDYDLVLRISERYAIGRVWEPIYEVIRHSGGTDHAIDQATIDRNDNAKDHMRLAALERRKRLNGRTGG